MSFLGKEFKFVKQENFEEFVKSLGLSEEQAQGFINYTPTQSLVKNGDSYTFLMNAPNRKIELNFKLGVEFDENIAGRNCKSTFTLDGNTLTQVQKFDDGVVFNFKREFTDTDLVATITCTKWDGVARRYYKA